MDLKQIKELMAAMGRAGIKKLSIKEKTGYELLLERHEEHLLAAPLRPEDAHGKFIPPQPVLHSSLVDQFPKPKEEVKVEGVFVASPMVGTFYSSPSPGDPPFAKVGDFVDENTVLCIIEAMKVMNEVKAGKSGKIAEVCLESGHPVEFGTKLFRIV